MLEYILLRKEQISRVSRWCVIKNYFVKSRFLFLNNIIDDLIRKMFSRRKQIDDLIFYIFFPVEKYL